MFFSGLLSTVSVTVTEPVDCIDARATEKRVPLRVWGSLEQQMSMGFQLIEDWRDAIVVDSVVLALDVFSTQENGMESINETHAVC